MRSLRLPLRIGTRSSALATTQTSLVAAALAERNIGTVLVPIITDGDRSRAPLHLIGGTGVFVTAVRGALLDNKCDIAVHSLKDLPVNDAEGLVVAAIPARADARDVLCARDGLTLDTLPPGSVIGTGSPRRAAYVQRQRPDLNVVGLRGNVDSRLAKVTSGELDAVVLAAAGLARLDRLDAVTEYFEPLDALPAPGQGALAIECRADDAEVLEVLAGLDHLTTRLEVTAERAVLGALDAGCTAPIGAYASTVEGVLSLRAGLWREADMPPLAAEGTITLGHAAASPAATGTVTTGPAVTSDDVLPGELVDQAEVLGAAVAAQLGEIGAHSYLAAIDALRERGRHVGAPRAADGSPRWQQAIAAANATPVDIDLLQTVPPAHPERVLELVQEIHAGHYDALVLTSARTAAVLAAAAANLPGLAAAQAEHGFFTACIGPATTQAARRIGLHVDIALDCDATTTDLAAAIIRHFDTSPSAPPRRHVALPQSELADPLLAELLRDRDCIVDVVGAYTVRAHPSLADQIKSAELDTVILASRSSVQAWLALDTTRRSGVSVVCVGRAASSAAQAASLAVAATSPTPAATEITRALRAAHGDQDGAHTDPPAPDGEGT